MRSLAVLAALAALAAAAPARANLLIEIDKAKQQMTVTADGVALYTWPVSTGIARYDTPNGTYTPFRKEKEHFSREWDDAPMPYSIFFTMKGHAIHGTNHKGLGHPASHGCVRLSVAHAAILWDLVARHKMANTTVVLSGAIPAEAPAVAQAERRTISTAPPAEPQYGAAAPGGPQYDDGEPVLRPPQRIDPPPAYDDERPRGLFPFLFGR